MTATHLIGLDVRVRDLPDRSRIRATFRVEHLSGNEHPYFSATADIYEAHGTWSGEARERNGCDIDAGGCLHDEIVRCWPSMAPFVAMHLSDWPSGRPMHAAANGRYHAENGRPDLAASLLRCGETDLPTVFDVETWEAFCDAQTERWADEAAAAFMLLTRSSS